MKYKIQQIESAIKTVIQENIASDLHKRQVEENERVATKKKRFENDSSIQTAYIHSEEDKASVDQMKQ